MPFRCGVAYRKDDACLGNDCRNVCRVVVFEALTIAHAPALRLCYNLPNAMEPKHAVEYELTSEMATDIQRTLLRFALRHGWRRDVPLLLGWLVVALLLAWPVLAGWMPPGVGGGILFLATLFVLAGVYRRHWHSY